MGSICEMQWVGWITIQDPSMNRLWWSSRMLLSSSLICFSHCLIVPGKHLLQHYWLMTAVLFADQRDCVFHSGPHRSYQCHNSLSWSIVRHRRSRHLHPRYPLKSQSIAGVTTKTRRLCSLPFWLGQQALLRQPLPKQMRLLALKCCVGFLSCVQIF